MGEQRYHLYRWWRIEAAGKLSSRFPTLAEGAAAVVKATTGQFLDEYLPYIKEALEKVI